ncbi:hypothetical protein CR513_25586, partial [Mucuna pruriens]
MASDRSQNMIKKESEGFKEYAQRWRELAAQVQPPIMESEMVTMFIDTLPSPYYDRIVGNVASNFVDLVVVGERIELGIRRGNFTQTNNSASFTKKPAPERKKGEGKHSILCPDPGRIPISNNAANALHPTEPAMNRRQDRRQHMVNTVRGKKVEHGANPDPDGLHQFVSSTTRTKLIEVVPLMPLELQYPRSYDPNTRCDYHGRAIGHATERCRSLKHKVQDLLDNGLLEFEDKGPNVHRNPLPAHGTMALNAINHEDGKIVKWESRKAVVSAYRVEEGSYPGQGNNAATIVYVEGNENPRPKPLIIQYNLAPKPRVPFIIQVPTRLAYNNNAVPWSYSTEESPIPQIKKETIDLEVTNIAGTRGMTRSGRIFALEALRNRDPTPAKQEKTVELLKRVVTEEEA